MLAVVMRDGHGSGVSVDRVVVTGGRGGLGVVIAEGFREHGYEVWNPGRNELDVTDEEAVSGGLGKRKADLLVCCAGVTGDSLVARLGEEGWNRVWDVNFHGAMRCAEAVLPGMRKRGRGHIVFLSSHGALRPPPGQSAYASSKAALLGLAAALAVRVGPDNIRVNSILPGFLDNRMTAPVSEGRREEVLAGHALGRFNTMDRVARFIRFLHEEMPHTSGQAFVLDNRPAAW